MNFNVFKNTTDNWRSSFDLPDRDNQTLVEVTFHGLELNIPPEQYYRVSVCGADDFGMVMDFESEGKAWQTFVEIIGWEDVTIQALTELGFTGDN